MTFYRGNALGTLLIAEGLCPPNARNVQLHVPVDGLLVLHYEVMVATADLPKIARAVMALAAGAPRPDAALNGGGAPRDDDA